MHAGVSDECLDVLLDHSRNVARSGGFGGGVLGIEKCGFVT